MFSLEKSTIIFYTAKTMVPPRPMTQAYMQGFRKNTSLSSVMPNSAIHKRFDKILQTLQKDEDPLVKRLGLTLGLPHFEDSQLMLIQKLFTQLWQYPVTDGHVKLLQLLVDEQRNINIRNYFDYLTSLYGSWEETLKVAMIHNAYDELKGPHILGIGDKITWAAIEAQARQYPDGTTARAKRIIDASFAIERERHDTLLAQARAALPTTEPCSSSTAGPCSSSSAGGKVFPAPSRIEYGAIQPKGEARARAEAEAVDAKSSFLTTLIDAIQQDTNDVLVLDIAQQIVDQYGDLGFISNSFLTLARNELQSSTYHYLVEHTLSKVTSSSTASQPSAPPAPASSSIMLQPSAPPAPTSSTVILPVLTITPEISPSMVYHGNLLIDTKVTATYQGTKGARDPVHVIFIVDVSGSMQPAIPDVQRTLTDMIETKLRAGDKVSIIKFSHEASVVANAATLPDGTLENTIKTAIVAGGSTCIFTGFECLESLIKTDLETHIILATDGQDFAFSPDFDPKIHTRDGAVVTPERYVDRSLISKVKKYLGEFVPVHTIGMTTEVDQRVTGLLSTKTGTAQRFIRSANDIGKELDGLATYICADDRAPAGRVTLSQAGRVLQTLSIPSLPSGNSFPQLLRLPLSEVDVNQPMEIRYEFPGISPSIWQVNHDGSIVANIAPIAADMLNRYEQMIAADSRDLKAKLLQLLVEIIDLKTTYQHAPWIELDEAEYKVRRYIDAIERSDIATQMQYNVDTICLKSIVTPAPAAQSASSTATSQSTNGSQQSPPSSSTQQSLITAPLNQDNVAAHIEQASQKGWRGMVIALQTFAGQAVSLESKLFNAINRSDMVAIQQCFTDGVDPKQVDSKGWSWVMQALGKAADVEVIQALVEQGVPLDVCSKASRVSALEMANSHLSAFQVGTFPDKQTHVDRLTAIVAYLQQQTPVPTPASPLIQRSLFPAASSSGPSPVASAMPKELQNMLCPVSMEIMENPVILSTGISVEESIIVMHLAVRAKQGLQPTCPLSGVPLKPMLEGQYYVSNLTLKNTINEWQQQQPSTSIAP